MLEEKIFKEILEVWSLDQQHPRRDRKQKSLPSISDVKVMIETSFLASLRREEDKVVTFAAALLPENKLQEEEKLSGRKQLILNFDKKLPFIESSILKLAPAFNPKTSALMVEPKEGTPNEYEIWGVMFFSPTKSRFDEIPVAIDGFNYFRPDVMMVTAMSIGSLIISRGDSQIGRFTSGEFIAATPTPFTSVAIGNYMVECIKEDEGYKKHKNSYWHIFRDAVEYLLSEASNRGHGGTIIILPEHAEKKCRGEYIDRYPFNKDLEVEKIILKFLNLPKHHGLSSGILLNRLLAERLSFLAQLSCIDGALILNGKLNPISFGATLNSKRWNRKVIIGPNGFNSGGAEFDLSNLGTRHASAINFIGGFDGIIGFVISQDGPIRAFTKKDDNAILCWPDCRVSMFI